MLEITEVQIDKYNDTYNKLFRFENGLNIITGQNEAGKSTLMSFITNIFKGKSDAEGYLKCNCNGEELKLEAKKTKQKANIPCLEKITSKNFEQGFFIDLDNLMQVKKNSAEELLATIKDSSGAAVNAKQKEYVDKITAKSGFSLTSKSSASTYLKREFTRLNELSDIITNLQSQEHEYNRNCSKLEDLQKEIAKLETDIKHLETAIKAKEIKSAIADLKINRKLLENKDKFLRIKEQFYSLNTKDDKNYLMLLFGILLIGSIFVTGAVKFIMLAVALVGFAIHFNSISSSKKAIDDYIKTFNEFISDTELEIMPVSKERFENIPNTINEIEDVFEESMKNNVLRQTQLSELEKLDINEDIIADETMLRGLKEELSAKRQEQAITYNEVMKLKDVESLLELKNRKNAELNRLKRGLNNLFVREIVLKIIQKSKEEFNSIQPNLVSAKDYLAQITDGKYTEIDFDNMTVSGEDTAEKDWDKLSRGTKEQLYLALRLGYAANYSKDKDGNDNGRPNLPLIIDDAFVNFDRTRTQSVLKCLKEFSKTNQVLYFTCHSQGIEEFIAGANVINL